MNMNKMACSAFIALGLLATGTNSWAGDCKKVSFRFVNKLKTSVGTGDLTYPRTIKVKSILIQGNDGTWVEDIANKKIVFGNSYTTGKRRLNKLDSGSVGKFTINYEWVYDGVWLDGTHGPFSFNCKDGNTLQFTIAR